MKSQGKFVPDYEVIVCAPEESFRWDNHDYPHYLAKWNYHPEYELHLTCATSGTMMVGDYLGDFQPGNLVLTGPNVPHNWVSNLAPGEHVRGRDMLIQFTADWADRIAGLCPEVASIRTLYDDAAYGVEFSGASASEGRGLLTAIGRARGAERVCLFLRLMLRLSENPAERRRLSRQAMADPAAMPSALDAAKRFINENYAGEISLETVAAEAGLTPQTFSRGFKRQTGHTFASYLVLTRVYAACTLLIQSRRPVTEICFDVGFNSIGNFNRQFLKVCGRTPSEYRREAKRIGAVDAGATGRKMPQMTPKLGGKGYVMGGRRVAPPDFAA
jgi:AraC-like DNA-binding protein